MLHVRQLGSNTLSNDAILRRGTYLRDSQARQPNSLPRRAWKAVGRSEPTLKHMNQKSARGEARCIVSAALGGHIVVGAMPRPLQREDESKQ